MAYWYEDERYLVWYDDVIEVYCKPSGWIADVAVKVILPDTAVEFVGAVFGENLGDLLVPERICTSDEVTTFMISNANNPFGPNKEYSFSGSYRILPDGEYCIVGFNFTTTERYPSGGFDETSTSPPEVVSVNWSDYGENIGIVISLNTDGASDKFELRVYIYNSNNGMVFSSVYDSMNPEYSDIQDWGFGSFAVTVEKNNSFYGQNTIEVISEAEGGSKSLTSSLEVFFSFSYRYIGKNNSFFSASEWNRFGKALESVLDGYTHHERAPGVEITPDILGAPLSAYYLKFRKYYRSDIYGELKPPQKFYFGKVPSEAPALSAGDYFRGLCEMLNSLLLGEE